MYSNMNLYIFSDTIEKTINKIGIIILSKKYIENTESISVEFKIKFANGEVRQIKIKLGISCSYLIFQILNSNYITETKNFLITELEQMIKYIGTKLHSYNYIEQNNNIDIYVQNTLNSIQYLNQELNEQKIKYTPVSYIDIWSQ